MSGPVRRAGVRLLAWFAARSAWLKVVAVLLGWPVLLAARLAVGGSRAAVAMAVAVALVGQPAWLSALTPSDRSAEHTATEEVDEPEPAAPEPAADGSGAEAQVAASDAEAPDDGAVAGRSPSEDPDLQRNGGAASVAPDEPAAAQQPQPASGGGAAVSDLLAALATAPERRTGYDRDLFTHWVDADGDGCNTREEVLIAESTVPATTGAGCRVTGGAWFSYYDATWVYESSSLDIDHLVPLAEAWDSGAHSWDAATRRAFANDLDEPRALIAVTSGSNRSKSDQDPAQWMPPDRGYWCVYVADWVVTKHRWQLSVDTAERAALQRHVDGCGDLRVDAGAQVTPGTAPNPPPPAFAPGPAPSPGEGTSSGSEARVFVNCAELRAVYPNGVAREDAAGNLVSGELRPLPSGVVVDTALYEANRARDGDKDGVACE